MLTLSESLRLAESYAEQVIISQPAQAVIKLQQILKGILGDTVYQAALSGEYDYGDVNLRQGEVSGRE